MSFFLWPSSSSIFANTCIQIPDLSDPSPWSKQRHPTWKNSRSSIFANTYMYSDTGSQWSITMIETETSHMREIYLTIKLPLLLIKKNYHYRDVNFGPKAWLRFYPFANSNFMVPMGSFDIISHILVTWETHLSLNLKICFGHCLIKCSLYRVNLACRLLPAACCLLKDKSCLCM